jgi:putative transposase
MANKVRSEERIRRVWREAELGETVMEAWYGGVPQAWERPTELLSVEKEIPGLRLSELRELGQLHEENTRLKRPLADLRLDCPILQEIVAKKI